MRMHASIQIEICRGIQNFEISESVIWLKLKTSSQRSLLQRIRIASLNKVPQIYLFNKVLFHQSPLTDRKKKLRFINWRPIMIICSGGSWAPWFPTPSDRNWSPHSCPNSDYSWSSSGNTVSLGCSARCRVGTSDSASATGTSSASENNDRSSWWCRSRRRSRLCICWPRSLTRCSGRGWCPIHISQARTHAFGWFRKLAIVFFRHVVLS